MTYNSYNGQPIEQVTSTAYVNKYGDFSQAYYSPQQYAANAVAPLPPPPAQKSMIQILGLGLMGWGAWWAGLL